MRAVGEVDLPSVPNCRFHPGRDSVDRCAACEAPICGECVKIFDDLDLCPACAAARRATLERDLKAAEADLSRAEGALRAYIGAITDEAHADFRTKRDAASARIDRIRRTLAAS